MFIQMQGYFFVTQSVHKIRIYNAFGEFDTSQK